nr:killer cell lectin-like receptor subfamily B member 1B allele B isoform X1 [Chrysemys picta bellii]
MAGEIVPADLNIPGDPSSRGKVAPSQHHNRPRCPYWHWLALGLTLAGNVVLLRVVMALAARGSLNPSLTGAVPKTMENETSAQPSPKGRGCSDLEEFRSRLRQHLCYTQNKQPAESSSCKLCPKDWLLHGDKCYWFSTAIKTWEWSHDDCLMKRAQLLVIDDREEMVKNVLYSTAGCVLLLITAGPKSQFSLQWEIKETFWYFLQETFVVKMKPTFRFRCIKLKNVEFFSHSPPFSPLLNPTD